MTELEQAVVGRAELDRHAGSILDRQAVGDRVHRPGRHRRHFGVTAEGHRRDDRLVDLEAGDVGAELVDPSGSLVADDVRGRCHRPAGAVQQVATLDANRLDCEDDPALPYDRVGDIDVLEHLWPTGPRVRSCLHQTDATAVSTIGNARPTRDVAATMTTIGLIGAGNIGSTVARLAVDAGHDVVLSNSRGPETLGDLVSQLGPAARAATAEEAAAAGDVVVVTVPLKAYRDVPVEPLAGKVVIDTNNYYPERDGHIAELDDESTTTSELLQAHLPQSHVVKAFNNMFYEHLAALPRPAGSSERTALAIAGDDADAKQTVTHLFDDLGYDALDVGPLAEGWRYQRDTAAYAGLYATGDDWSRPRQVTTAELSEALEAAQRYRDMS